MHSRFGDLSSDSRSAAESSEDAFDAIVSARRMRNHAAQFAELGQSTEPVELLEGRIWRPD